MTLSLLDTTILSNFAHVQRPDLVQTVLGETAATTAVVMAELRRGEELGLVTRGDWAWLQLLDLTAAEKQQATLLQQVLDAGEAECLAVATARRGRFFSDDFAARRLAQEKGVPVSGTIGLLLQLIDSQTLPVAIADSLLDVMRQYGYRAPATSLQAYLDDWESSS